MCDLDKHLSAQQTLESSVALCMQIRLYLSLHRPLTDRGKAYGCVQRSAGLVCGCVHLCLCLYVSVYVFSGESLFIPVNLKACGWVSCCCCCCCCYTHIKLSLQALVIHGPCVQHGRGQDVCSLSEVLLGRLVSRGELGSVAVGLSAARRAHVQGQGNIGAPPV